MVEARDVHGDVEAPACATRSVAAVIAVAEVAAVCESHIRTVIIEM